MKRLILTCALALAVGNASAAEGFDVAVTVDDLSVHGPLPKGTTWPAIARSYIATLKAHRVPEAWGFVNGKKLVDQPDSAGVLDAWRAAGYPLGNHAYSHMGLSRAPSLQAWLDDVKAGEAAVASRMGQADWRVFRYPFLDGGGGDQARHDGAAAWLKEQGYRIADVSLSFDDWAYTEAYGRCLAKGDQEAIAAMKREYMARVDLAISRAKVLSQRVYGRMIPQVLLTHLGAWSAATLPEVMARLDAAGARYVTLDRAQSDPAYREPSPRSGVGSLMERRAGDAGIDMSGIPAVASTALPDAFCR